MEKTPDKMEMELKKHNKLTGNSKRNPHNQNESNNQNKIQELKDKCENLDEISKGYKRENRKK